MARSRALDDEQWERLPSTLQRSPAKAQRTYTEALESAEQVKGHEGDDEYAHRVAFAAVKHSFEKVGDHWEAKDSKGPSDSQAEAGGPRPKGESHGGVDANASKDHLVDVARRVGVDVKSRMTKSDLVEEIEKANNRSTAKARENT